jgi:hypothetical protein
MLYHIQLPEPRVSPLNVIWYVFHIVQVVLTFVSSHSLKLKTVFRIPPSTPPRRELPGYFFHNKLKIILKKTAYLLVKNC